MGWFVIILLILIFCWPWISRFVRGWISRYMARRAEDMVRRMMGAPPRSKEKKRHDKRTETRSQGFKADEYGAGSSAKSYRRGRSAGIAALMQLVAVDVSFVEIKEFSSTVIGRDGESSYSFRYEEQISDVKFVEIKD